MKKLAAALLTLLLAGSAAAQTTSRYFAGDYKYTAPPFMINANTASGSDTGRMTISGGGGAAAADSRGAWIRVDGSDVGGAGAGGDVSINGGDSGDILLDTDTAGDISLSTGSTGSIIFETNSQRKWLMPYTAAATSELVYGILGTANWSAYVINASNDGTDSGRLSLSGGGAIGTNRGGRIDLYGADRGGAGAGGDVDIYSADDGDILLVSRGSGDVVLNGSGATSYIDFETNGQQKWFIAPTAADTSELYFGILGTANWVANILNSSNDGSDSGRLTLSGGGGVGTTRGGRIDLYGADRGGAGLGGDVILVSADDGDILIQSRGTGDVVLNGSGAGSYIDFEANGEQKWFIDPSAASTSGLYYGILGSANWIGNILAATADGSDNSRLRLSGGGTANDTRGAWLELDGSDYGGAGAGGNAYLVSGDNGSITIDAKGTGSFIVKQAADTKWAVPSSAAATSDLVFGVAGEGNYFTTIRGATADGSDSGRLTLTTSDTIGTTRSGRIDIYGADRGGAGAGGDVSIITADNGNIELNATGTAQVILKTSNTTRWTVNSDGTLDANVTNAGWRIASAADTACTTTCGANKGCLFGQDHTAANKALVSCTDAAADTCVCTTT